MQILEIEPTLLRDEANKLALAILKKDNFDSDIGFLGGRSGIAFFLCYLGAKSGNESLSNKGIEVIEQIHEEISCGVHKKPTFCGGVTGYFWTLEYLAQAKIISIDTDDLLEDADEYLYGELKNLLAKGNLDFLHGAGGIIVYFLRRIKGNSRNIETLKAYLHIAVESIVKNSIDDGKAKKWNSYYTIDDGKPSTNISISHGISSIIVILCKLIEGGIAINKSKTLLRKAVNYIVTNTQDVKQYGSHFPTYSLDGRAPTTSRLGWCYGDLGVLNALMIANQILNNPTIKLLIQNVETHLQARRNLKEDSVIDACICHGTAGIALFAHMVYTKSPSVKNKEFMSFWTNATLQMKSENKEMYYYNHGRSQQTIKYNFLEGISGIGLLFTAIGYSNEKESDWLESLLLC